MADLFGYDPGRAEGDVGVEMAARFSEDGKARLALEYVWDRKLPAAAWLMNNPSVAGQLRTGERVSFDPTARRVIHFSRMVGAGAARLVNWCPLIATDPAFLWRMLRDGAYTDDLVQENMLAVARAGSDAGPVFIATGPEGMRRYPGHVRRAAMLITAHSAPLCLGTTDYGAPLHPLARGKFAIPNDRRPVPFDLSDWSARYAG